MKKAEELKKDITFETKLCGRQFVFRSTWGLFSPRSIDEGSALLLKYLEIGEKDVTLDLGCGYGALGIPIASLCPHGKVWMVDKDFIAIEYTEKNAQINQLSNVKPFLSNGFSHVSNDVKFDTIVSNIPAKVGRELLYILLTDARQSLNKNGQIVVVTINGLRKFIKRNFLEVFGNYEKLKQGKSYTVARATNL